jgi:hypothetical protein
MKVRISTVSEAHSIRSLIDDGREYLITLNDVIGAIACWAVRQSPYVCPNRLAKVLKIVEHSMKHCNNGRWNHVAGMHMGNFTFQELEQHLQEHLGCIPEVKKWNQRKNNNAAPIKVTTLYSTGADPDDDFIDLDALYRNIAGQVMSEAEDFRLFNEEFENKYGSESSASGIQVLLANYKHFQRHPRR